MTFVLLAGNVFTSLVDLVINQGVDILGVLKIFLYMLPFIMVFTIPMAALVAVLLAFGRFSADHEIIAFRANGISLGRVMRPVLWVAFVVSLFTFFLNDQIASRSHFKVRLVSAEIGLKTPAALLEEGVFIKNFKDIILFIHRIEGNELREIRIYQPQENGPTRTIVAEKGELIPVPEQNVIKLKLTNGISDEPDANNPGRFYKLKFGTYFLPLDVSKMKLKGPVNKKRKELTLRELSENFFKLKNEGFVDPYLLTEINHKIAMPFSVFVLVLIGIPLAIKTRRGEKSIGFALAVVLGTAYWVLLIAATSISKSGAVPAWFIIHLPNAIFLCFGTLMTVNLLRT